MTWAEMVQGTAKAPKHEHEWVVGRTPWRLVFDDGGWWCIEESVGTSKLTAEKVLQIRARLRSGVRREHVAREFGVRPSNVTWIAKRRTWKHVPDTTGGAA